MKKVNVFGTVVTNAAPSANYRGETEGNLTPLQKITIGDEQFPSIHSESIRNGIRETWKSQGIEQNRSRIDNASCLSVAFKEINNYEKFPDDDWLAFMMTGEKISKEDEKIIEKLGYNKESKCWKRNSVFHVNSAVSMFPFYGNKKFTQTPNIEIGGKKQGGSGLVEKEICHTSFQYPFNFNSSIFKDRQDRIGIMLHAIDQLHNVAGDHARTYYTFNPASAIYRLSSNVVSGYESYCFKTDEDGNIIIDKYLIDLLKNNDFDCDEFYISGKVVYEMDKETKDILTKNGVHFFNTHKQLVEKLLEDIKSNL